MKVKVEVKVEVRVKVEVEVEVKWDEKVRVSLTTKGVGRSENTCETEERR